MLKRIFSSGLNVDIDTRGAELINIKSKVNNCDYLWDGKEEVWGKHAPVLFPVVGKLKNFSYKYEDKDYVLMQHGFAKDLEFKITSEKENEICMLLESNDITMEYYPFKFALLARYTARDTKLEVEYVVTNLNNKPMPFSLGVHPGFRCPLEPGLGIEDYYLEFNEKEDFVRIPLNGGLGTNERVKLCEPDTELWINKEMFSGDAIVLENPNSTQITLASTMDSKKVKITFPKVPYLGLWSKPLKEGFVCIEPWFGMSDFEDTNFNIMEKPGIQTLLPYQVFQLKYSMEFE